MSTCPGFSRILKRKKQIPDSADKLSIIGDFITAGSRTRTGTDVTPRDFKSLASANFAMPAQL